MSKLDVIDMKGVPVGQVELADALLSIKGGTQAVHDVVVAYQAGLRAGTASTQNKGEVAGSGKKPWKQKGTGRARAGYRRSPVWRGGGVAFGPRPRDFSKTIPKKVAQLAFQRAFSDKIKAGELRVLQSLELSAVKTKAFVGLMKALNLSKGVLFIVDKPAADVVKASRNLPEVEVCVAQTVSTYQLLRYPMVVITQAALESLRTRLEARKGEAV